MMTNLLSHETLSMTSREIAELTGKRHDHVLRDIDGLLETLNPELGYGFKPSTYVSGDPPREYRQFELDRDSAYCLVAGYDPNSRMKIIKRWQELEASSHVLPQSFADALQLAADQQRIIEAQARDNALLNTIIDNEFGYCSILRAAQHLKIHEKAFKWQTLKKATLEAGLEVKRVPSPRYEYQNLYPIKVFERCYPQYDFSGLQPEAVATRATKLLAGQVRTVSH